MQAVVSVLISVRGRSAGEGFRLEDYAPSFPHFSKNGKNAESCRSKKASLKSWKEKNNNKDFIQQGCM